MAFPAAELGVAPPGTVEAEALAIAIHTHPMPRKTGRRIAVIIGGMLVIWAFLAFARWYYGAPERVIDKYFDALGNRNFDSAVAQMAAGTPPRQSALMAPAVLRNAGYTPPMDVQIESVNQQEGRTTAEVSFLLGDTRHTVYIDLERSETSAF
jgi:hypothetical protein